MITTPTKKIVAIGGAVIKTGGGEGLKELVKMGEIELLIHNGGSLFHDFQIAIDEDLRLREITSYPLEELLIDYSPCKAASKLVWEWLLDEAEAPEDSLTHQCEISGVPVLMFTALGADFWHLSVPKGRSWADIANYMESDFYCLCSRMSFPFHYICMGSAVIHPEVFTKVLAVVGPLEREFRADVVDFLEAYRPRTRVAVYGNYYQMTHVDFLRMWIENGIP